MIRRIVPWLVAVAILVLLATRVPFAAFKDAITHGPHLVLASVDAAVTAFVLCTDTFATWIGLIVLKMRRPFGKVFAVRAATSILMLLNYALGQGAFGYYLHKSGVKPLRAVGATLFLMGTNLATLLILTTIAWQAHGTNADPRLWWILLGGCGGFLLYLVVIALSPGPIRRREIFEPLFATGVRGHLLGVAGRVPHVIAIVIGLWLAMRAWNVPVPFWYGLAVLPIVVIASVLPISPAGLGTTQAAFVYFFASYATGSTPEVKSATILAFSIAHFVYSWLALIVIGLFCTPVAKRAVARDTPEEL